MAYCKLGLVGDVDDSSNHLPLYSVYIISLSRSRGASTPGSFAFPFQPLLSDSISSLFFCLRSPCQKVKHNLIASSRNFTFVVVGNREDGRKLFVDVDDGDGCQVALQDIRNLVLQTICPNVEIFRSES